MAEGTDDDPDYGPGCLSLITIVPLIFVGIILLVIGGYELRKFYWDFRVSQLCDEDAGLAIYKRVGVTASEYSNLPRCGGYICFDFKEKAISNGDIAYVKSQSTTLRLRSPKIFRYKGSIIDIRSGDIVAETITYARVGGDFPIGLGPGSSYSCPSDEQIISMRRKMETIFYIKE